MGSDARSSANKLTRRFRPEILQWPGYPTGAAMVIGG